MLNSSRQINLLRFVHYFAITLNSVHFPCVRVSYAWKLLFNATPSLQFLETVQEQKNNDSMMKLLGVEQLSQANTDIFCVGECTVYFGPCKNTHDCTNSFIIYYKLHSFALLSLCLSLFRRHLQQMHKTSRGATTDENVHVLHCVLRKT